MKKLNITKREIAFFFLGLFTMLVIEIIYDWSDFKKGLIDGWNGARTEVKK